MKFPDKITTDIHGLASAKAVIALSSIPSQSVIWTLVNELWLSAKLKTVSLERRGHEPSIKCVKFAHRLAIDATPLSVTPGRV